MRNSPEFLLIGRIRDALEAAGARTATAGAAIGDDAAVVETDGAPRITSIDLCVEGVHFTTAFSDEQIGRKALAAALSDLAAMGASPAEAYVGLIAPPGFDPERAVAIATGIGAVAAEHEVAVLGGDISSGPGLALAVTVVGTVAKRGGVVRRSGAQPGDVLLVSGELGAAAAGLELINDPALAEPLPAEIAASLRARQYVPRPLLALGGALRGCGASAMIDLSDGIVADAEQLATESGVAIEIEVSALPIAGGVDAVARATGRDRYELASLGEDYELLVTVPADKAAQAVSAARDLGERLTPIGTVRAGSGLSFGEAGDRLRRGFDHLDHPD